MTSTIRTDLFNATRRNNSVNGNPRYDLHTSDGTFTTQSDGACAYDVDNIIRTIPHGETIPVTLHTTRAGRVWNIERPTTPTRVVFRVGTDPETIATVLHLVSTDDESAMRRKIAAAGLTSPHQFPASAVTIVSSDPIA